jgi:hypothetical protein
MYIQLLIEGRPKKIWFAEDFPIRGLDEQTCKQRSKYINDLIIECAADAGELIYGRYEYEFCLLISSRPNDDNDFWSCQFDLKFPENPNS